MGITKQTLKERLSQHLYLSEKENRYKYNWIQKIRRLNKKPIIELIEEGLIEKYACDLEIELIASYRDFIGKKLTNIANGGNLPPIHYGDENHMRSEKSRKLFSEKFMGNKNPMYGIRGELHPSYGKPRPDDVKKKISKSHEGKIISEETRKKLIISNSGKNNGMYDKKHTEESKKKISETRIKRNYKGERSPMFGTGGPLHPRNKKVYQIDKNTNCTINTFYSLANATEQTGIYCNHISAVCHGRNKTAGGFKWKFV